jgi:hypothetical protein
MAEIDAASGWNTASPALQTRVPAPPRLAVPDGMAIHQKISAFHGHNSASMKRELRDDAAELLRPSRSFLFLLGRSTLCLWALLAVPRSSDFWKRRASLMIYEYSCTSASIAAV